MSKPNPFALLGVPETFALADDVLQKAYIRQQQACHPDRFVNADAAMRQQAIMRSMDANEAHQTLKSPVKRAQALLAMHGLAVGVDGRDAVQPTPALLGEVMEWREALFESETPEACARVLAQLQEAEADTMQQLHTAFAAQQWMDAAHATLRLQYLDKTLQDAKSRHRQLTQRA